MAMMKSRSSVARARYLAALVVVGTVLAAVVSGGVAEAGKKRVVVLDFEGPKGERFHDDLVKLIKKSHTIVPTDKWNGVAEELDASDVSDRNIKKVARKLKVDAVVEGRIEKRRDAFIIRLKLHAGSSGEQVGASVDTKATGPRIDGRAQRDIDDELVDAIDNLDANRGGGGDDDEPAVARKASKKAAADDDDKPVRKGFSKRTDDERGGDKVAKKAGKKLAEDADDKPAKKADDKLASKPASKPAKKPDDEPANKLAKVDDDDDDKLPPNKRHESASDKPARKRAAAREDDDSGELEAEAPAR